MSETLNGIPAPPFLSHVTGKVTVSVALMVNIRVSSGVSSNIDTVLGRLLITGS